MKWLGNLVLLGGILGTFFHYVRYGPRRVHDDQRMKTEMPRFSFAERAIHWLAALSFLYAALDRPGAVVAAAVLAGFGLRRRQHGAGLAPLGRSRFLARSRLHVSKLGRTDAAGC